MALTATMRRFEIALADSDRELYETLELRVAQHPSETDRYLVMRVIARCLEHAQGVELTRGLCVEDEPAIWQRDLQGTLRAWIEIGSPSVERLHKASKTGARVAVYGWKLMDRLAAGAADIHRADELSVFSVSHVFLDEVAATLDRLNRWSLVVSGGSLYLSMEGRTFEATVERLPVVG